MPTPHFYLKVVYKKVGDWAYFFNQMVLFLPGHYHKSSLIKTKKQLQFTAGSCFDALLVVMVLESQLQHAEV